MLARHGWLILVALLIAIFAGAGCVERTIKITSTPPGALVYLNDEEVGRTPVEVPFTFYGKYDVRLEADGYAPLWIVEETKPPWWENPGPDFFAEAVPNAKSQIDWHFELTEAQPVEDVDPDQLYDRAMQLRSQITGEPYQPAPSEDEPIPVEPSK